MRKTFLWPLFLSILLLTACSPLASLQATPTASPSPTVTLTPTATWTPTPTLTPTITPTPTPQNLSIEQVWENCEQLAQDGREVWVSGLLFLPKWKIIGYPGWKGLDLKEIMEEDQLSLTILVEVGDGPNTMNSLPQYFTERDLVVRADQGQEIRHGHSVAVFGIPSFKPDTGRCEIRASKIETLVSPEALVPEVVTISFIQEVYEEVTFGGVIWYVKNCALLSEARQFITVKGSLVNWRDALKSCTSGICTLEFSDGSGKLRVSFVQGDQPSSLFLSPENKASLIDLDGKLLNLQDQLILTGMMYAEFEGCTLSVYEIEKQP